jgi:HEAT repeat protein
MSEATPSADWVARRRQLESLLRLHAAVVMGVSNSLEAVRLLADALGSEDAPVREIAALALIEFGSDTRYALPELIQAVQDSSSLVRRRAIRAIANVGEVAWNDALPTLIAATEDEDDNVAMQALSTLGELGGVAAPAIPALVSALWTGDVRRRAIAGVALVRIGAASVPALVQSLAHPSAEVRSKAAHLLGRLGRAAESALPALRSLISDADETVRNEVAQALAAINEA